MFIFLLKYTKGLEAIDKALPEHEKYLEKFYKAGNFICSGRKVPRTGGIILCKASSFAEAAKITEEDPFAINGIVEYEIVEFVTTKYADAFKAFIR
jgi:uncharacterized protein YciI